MTFSVGIMLKKVVGNLVKVAVSWLAAHGLQSVGVQVNEEVLTLAILAGLESARNFAKVKFGWKWLSVLG